jgi:PAS domain-containing protein
MIDTDTKVPAGKSYTYENVLRIWAGSVQSTETAQENQLGQNLQDSLLEYGPAALYLANLQTLRYLYVSKNIERLSGYSPAEFMEKGPGFAYLLMMHPEDRSHILEHVHKRRLAFLGSLPAGAYKNYKFTYNYRFRKRNGTYIQLLNQEVVLQADAQGNPLLLTGMATDVSALEKTSRSGCRSRTSPVTGKTCRPSGSTNPGPGPSPCANWRSCDCWRPAALPGK